MNWSRVKTILIVLFLCVDAFLLTLIINSEIKSSAIPQEIIHSTVQLLKNNGITINEDLIPRKIVSAEYIQADNAITSYEDFAKIMLGRTISGSENSYSSEFSTITFNGDSFECNLTPPPYADMYTVSDEKSAVEFFKNTIENCGFDLSSAKINITPKDDRYIITIENQISKFPVFNSIITAEIYDSSSIKISGSWFNAVSATGQENTLKNVTGILIDFMSAHQTAEPTTITELAMGYSLLESDTYHKSAMLIPVWKITTQNNEIFYLDARNAE